MNVERILQSLLYIIFTAGLITLGLSALFGRKPEFHETVVILVFFWILAWIIARILMWLGGREKTPIPSMGVALCGTDIIVEQ